MISRISGTIVQTSDKFIVVDVNGVGYQTYVSADTIADVINNKLKDIVLWTHLAVRENSMELFGFREMEELKFFEMLIDISGIGLPSLCINTT